GADMTSEFSLTPTNMVGRVRNIIRNYQTPIRALAQEPVQNAKDAARGDVVVEYQLHTQCPYDGQNAYTLTITDSNTIGLRGRPLSLAQIQEQGGVLHPDERWARFEGMDYANPDEDALGSRGQGKAAFLYHSRLPSASFPGEERMMILYDTLLEDGEYRLGVRYASPLDTVLRQPFYNDAAREIITSAYRAKDGTTIPLALEPLTKVGTRVIVPHLSDEAVGAFRSGELYQWLQRCWWRAVQTGLIIELIDEQGKRERVVAPAWWEGEPWKERVKPEGLRLYSDIDVGDGLRIKRIVLRHDESIARVESEFWGVQLLRGQQ
ncbi:MAG: hypothetical protein J4F32_03585, partial [Dehalococcoidia bacterium]|nr:hypothetical protein [Dehalococcoidia bacterium]